LIFNEFENFSPQPPGHFYPKSEEPASQVRRGPKTTVKKKAAKYWGKSIARQKFPAP